MIEKMGPIEEIARPTEHHSHKEHDGNSHVERGPDAGPDPGSAPRLALRVEMGMRIRRGCVMPLRINVETTRMEDDT